MVNEVELVKVINKKRTFVNSKGKEVPSYIYFVSVNGQMIAVKPIFDDGYIKLDMVCRKVVKQ